MKTNHAIALGVGVGLGALLLRALRHRDTLAGKVVLIAGASRGLGMDLARRCLERGAKVAILSRNPRALKKAAVDLGGNVYAVTADVADGSGIKHAVALVNKHFGQIDVYMHVAGQIVVGPAKTMDMSDYRASLTTHVLGAIHGVNAVLPQMRERKAGRIVLIGSFGGKIAMPHMLPYTVGKFALTGYGQGLNAELANDGISVTTVSPGLMRTGSPRNADFKGQYEKEYAWFKIADSLPLLSLDSATAARRIVRACERRRAELMMMPLGTPLLVLRTLSPELFAGVLSLLNRALPRTLTNSHRSHKGYESESALTRSRMTALTRLAESVINELPHKRN